MSIFSVSPKTTTLITISGLLLFYLSSAVAKRVVVMDFRGPNNRKIRSVVEDGIRNQHTVISRSELQTEAKKLGVSTKCHPSIISGVASMVKADAVVCGRIRGRQRARLRISIFNGGDGKLIKVIRIRLSRKALERLSRNAKKINTALEAAWNWDSVEKKDKGLKPQEPSPSSEATSEPTTAATLPEDKDWENDDKENPLSRKVATRSSRPSTTVRAKPTKKQRAVGEHAVQLNVGPSFLLLRNYGVYNPGSAEDGQGWKTSPTIGLAFNVELFPAVWFTKGWASYIGLGLSYERYFGLGWKTAGSQEEHQATYQVFSVDLRGRYSIDINPRKLFIKARFGYRYLGFAMNDTPTVPAPIPDVMFSSLNLGLGVGFTILPRWLNLDTTFDYLPTFSKGEIATTEQYGAASVGGMRFGGVLSGAIVGPFGWKLALEYDLYMVTFKGDSTRSRIAEEVYDAYLIGALFFTYMN